MTYDATILADSPTAYWPLKEANGSTSVADSTGNGHGSSSVGSGVTLGTASLLSADSETAATFSGANDTTGRIEIPYSSAFSTTTKVTVEAWVKLSAIGANTARIFNAGVGGADGFAVGITSSGALRATAYSIADVTSTHTVSTGTIYYLAYVMDATASHVLFYVNGALVDTQSLSSLVGALSTVTIGNSANGSESGINGVIQKVAVYVGTALTATQISNHYNAGTASSTALTATAGVGTGVAPNATLGVAVALTASAAVGTGVGVNATLGVAVALAASAGTGVGVAGGAALSIAVALAASAGLGIGIATNAALGLGGALQASAGTGVGVAGSAALAVAVALAASATTGVGIGPNAVLSVSQTAVIALVTLSNSGPTVALGDTAVTAALGDA